MHTNRLLRPSLEALEARDCPAPLNLFLDAAGNLTITGTIDPAGLTIAATAPGTFTITDGVGPVGNVVTALPVPGNITVNTTNPGADWISVDLTLGGIFGGLSVSTGAGADVLGVTGVNAADIGGSVRLTGLNFINFFGTDIGGDFYAYNAADNLIGSLTLTTSRVGGSLTYTGGTDVDLVTGSAVQVGKNVALNLGNGLNFVGLDALSSVGGSLSITSGSGSDIVSVLGTIIGGSLTANLGTGVNSLSYDGSIGGGITYIGGSDVDTVAVGLAGVTAIGGNLYFNLGTAGANTLTLGTAVTSVGGGSITYLGGLDVDSVTLDGGLDAGRARVNISLGLGDDFAVVNTLALAFLSIDFGPGSDSYTPPAGPYTFGVLLRNLP